MTSDSKGVSGMRGQFIGPDSGLWRECLVQTRHDFHHMPGYARLCADREGGEPVAFVAEKGNARLFVPLIVRPIVDAPRKICPLYDAISPYGYPSPLVTETDSEQEQGEFLEDALRLFLSALRERAIVSAFVRLHPLLSLRLGPFSRHGTLVHHGETVFVDLTQSEEDLWGQTRSTHRRKIKQAERVGFVAEIDDNWKYFDDFFEIYTETMRRVNANDEYFFPRQYFCRLRDALGGALHLCVVRAGQVITCAGLFSEVCGIVQAHLAGSRVEHGGGDTAKLMFDFVRRWAKQRNNRFYHLGGGRGAEEDSLFQFKAGFSKSRASFHTWRAVADADAYQALICQWELRTGTTAEPLDGFFPAYRKPTPELGVPA